MPETKALCVFSTLLGKKTMVSMMRQILDRLPGVAPTYVIVGDSDYPAYPAPFWARATNPWWFEWIARRKAQPVLHGQYDILLVNSWELVVAFRDIARRLPSAAAMDAVPATFHERFLQRGQLGWKRSLSHQVHHRQFSAAVREFDYFFPKGPDCRESLCRDYGIASERCFVTLPPQYLEEWKTPPRHYTPPLRLLFASNNFEGKRGDFLLRIYAEHLADTCTLTIASNDPKIAERRLPSGVTWLRGRSREDMVEVYRDSDLFVLPTPQDFTPGVLGEALAMGLPCLATDIPGVRDMVIDGQTGFRVPFDAPPDAWAGHIRQLAANPSELSRMSQCARRFAEEMLDFRRFERLFKDVIGRLCSEARQRTGEVVAQS